MTSQSQDPQQVLILRDGAENYYLLSADVLAAARVPDDQKQQVEQALQQTGDVAGFAFNFSTAGPFVGALVQTNPSPSANRLGLTEAQLRAGPPPFVLDRDRPR